MSYDPSDQIATGAKWLDGAVLELRSRIGTVEGYKWDGLCIEQGRRVVLRLSWVDETGPIDLSTGYTADFQIRTTRDTSTSSLLTLDESSGITLGDSSTGQNIVVEITAAQSAALTFSRAYYELTVTHTATSTVQRLLFGACAVSRRTSA